MGAMPLPSSLTHSHPYHGRSALMSAVTLRQRVPDSPTCKLPRLALETDAVRHVPGAFHGADISRAPRADYEPALLISPRLLLHASLHSLPPNAYIFETRIIWQALEFDETPFSLSWRKSRRKGILQRGYFRGETSVYADAVRRLPEVLACLVQADEHTSLV